MEPKTRPVATGKYNRARHRVKRSDRTTLIDSFVVVLVVLAATGAIVLGGIIADSIPGYYWPIICMAILLVGMCVLAREDGR